MRATSIVESKNILERNGEREKYSCAAYMSFFFRRFYHSLFGCSALIHTGLSAACRQGNFCSATLVPVRL